MFLEAVNTWNKEVKRVCLFKAVSFGLHIIITKKYDLLAGIRIRREDVPDSSILYTILYYPQEHEPYRITNIQKTTKNKCGCAILF